MNLELIRKANLMKQKYKQSFDKIKNYKLTKKEIAYYCEKSIKDYKEGFSETEVYVKENKNYYKDFALNEYEKYLRKNRISATLVKMAYISEERKWKFKLKFVKYNGGIEWSLGRRF